MTEQSTGDAVPERWNAVGPKSSMWMDPAQDPRFAAGAELEGERTTLLDYLRAYRLALARTASSGSASVCDRLVIIRQRDRSHRVLKGS